MFWFQLDFLIKMFDWYFFVEYLSSEILLWNWSLFMGGRFINKNFLLKLSVILITFKIVSLFSVFI